VLTHIQIRDFAIVDAAELELGPGLTVLTGETGAGKSILVDALLLASGGRAGAEAVRHGADRAEVSAAFSVNGNAAALAWLAEQAIEHDGECVLRRVVGSDGRSRAYVNGQTMSVQAVRQLGETLVDVHGQMEYQSLVRSTSQRALLDASGEHEALISSVAGHWNVLARLREEHARATGAVQDRQSRLELLTYHLREFEALDLKPGEVEELLAERQRLSQRGRLAAGAREIAGLLREGEEVHAEQLVSRAAGIARTLAEVDAKLAPIARLIDESLIAMREGVDAVTRYESQLEADPSRQDWIEERLAAIEAVARKHRTEPGALLATRSDLAAECSRLESLEESLSHLEGQLAVHREAFAAATTKLTAGRTAAARTLAQRVTGLMQTLGMPGGKFEIEVRTLPEASIGAQGADSVEFLVSANPGQPPRALARVASGGELSRISLAIQVAAAQEEALPCLVFDEVDAGVGGGVAEIVGRQLRTLGEKAQVLCVTHLPQVASQAHAHVRVAKLTDGRATRTSLNVLTDDERVEEIARMLGGLTITQTAREHAAEMLRQPANTTPQPRARRKRS
jgi:DNA repair protein RecN (Recombination protein N)